MDRFEELERMNLSTTELINMIIGLEYEVSKVNAKYVRKDEELDQLVEHLKAILETH